jgi:hypothetical protein
MMKRKTSLGPDKKHPCAIKTLGLKVRIHGAVLFETCLATVLKHKLHYGTFLRLTCRGIQHFVARQVAAIIA